MVDVTDIRLETLRLRLRAIQAEDVRDLHAALSDPAVSALAGFPRCAAFDDSRRRVNRCCEKKNTLVAVLKETGEVIGCITMESRDRSAAPVDRSMMGLELGFLLGQVHWGHGFMPESLQALSSYCFRELHCDFLTCRHFPENHQCARILEKCGFRYAFDSAVQIPDGRTVSLKSYIRYASQTKED